MAYVKNTWVDREGQTRYHETIDDDGALIFTPDYEKVTEIGTPVNADNMNHIEDGIEDHENRITVLEEAGDTSNFLNKSQITNCILEQPKNVTLSCTSDTITLKAGSKVIVPNGVGVFDEVEITSDSSYSYVGTGSADIFILYNATSNTITYTSVASSTSGTTAPTGSGLWYDTTNNKVKFYSSGTANSYTYSFPLAIVSMNAGTITGIKQLFNGIGYIGSTVWVDKGVKGLACNGRNEDGTLNNQEFITSKIYTQTAPNSTYSASFAIEPQVDAFQLRNITTWSYNEEENFFNWTGDSKKHSLCEVANVNINAGVISNFQPKQPFQAVDYNDFKVLNTNALLKSDKSTIAGWSMPSQKTYTFTKGASGTTYTMPADGWLYVKATGSAGVDKGKWLYIGNQTSGISMQEATNFDIPQESIMPVRKNDVVKMTWGDLTLNTVKLYYLQGGN